MDGLLDYWVKDIAIGYKKHSVKCIWHKTSKYNVNGYSSILDGGFVLNAL